MYTTVAGDTAGDVSFTINGADLAGNALAQVTAVTDGSSMTFDKTAPTLSAVVISSDNDAASLAKPGDTVTLTFTSSEDLAADPSCAFTTGGVAVGGSVTVVGSASSWTCATVLTAGDAAGAVSFTIDGTAAAAGDNALVQVGDVTDGSSMMFDSEAPTLTAVSIASDNAASSLAKVDDTVTVTITASETIASPTCVFAGVVDPLATYEKQST